jgi:hypothetical protein
MLVSIPWKMMFGWPYAYKHMSVIGLAEMGPGGATEAETEALHPVAHACPFVPCRKNAGAHVLQAGVVPFTLLRSRAGLVRFVSCIFSHVLHTHACWISPAGSLTSYPGGLGSVTGRSSAA